MRADTVFWAASFLIGVFLSSCSGSSSTDDPTVTSSPTPSATPTPSPSALSWEQESYIKASNPDSFDFFGSAIAFHGDTLVVGAARESSNQTTITNGATSSLDNSLSQSGAVYVYKRSGNSWVQEAYLKAGNSGINDGFGGAVAIYGDTIAVSAAGEDSDQRAITNGSGTASDDNRSDSGAVYVYTRSGNTWTQQAFIKAVNAVAGAGFGSSVALFGDTLVVSAANESSSQTTITNGATASLDTSALAAGAAYVYKRTGSTWTQEAYLKAPNANSGDYFGTRVAIYSDTIVVGAPFEASNQRTITNGTTASSDNSYGQAGAAYVFRRTGTSWAHEAYLKAPNADPNDRFGVSVAIDRDTIAVGAQYEDSFRYTITNGTSAGADNDHIESGAAYVFKRTGSSWAQEAYFKASNSETNDEFHTVAISGERVFVGAWVEDSDQNTVTNTEADASSDNAALDSGAVYVFKRSGTIWHQEAYLKAPNSDQGDYFGKTLAADGDTVVIGAYAEGSNQSTITNGHTASADNSLSHPGAAYVFVGQ